MQSVIVAVEHLWGDIFRERMRKEPVVTEVHVVRFCNLALPELVTGRDFAVDTKQNPFAGGAL